MRNFTYLINYSVFSRSTVPVSIHVIGEGSVERWYVVNTWSVIKTVVASWGSSEGNWTEMVITEEAFYGGHGKRWDGMDRWNLFKILTKQSSSLPNCTVPRRTGTYRTEPVETRQSNSRNSGSFYICGFETQLFLGRRILRSEQSHTHKHTHTTCNMEEADKTALFDKMGRLPNKEKKKSCVLFATPFTGREEAFPEHQVNKFCFLWNLWQWEGPIVRGNKGQG